MKILVDENIPQAKEAFSSLGEVSFVAGRSISNSMLKDVDILLIRSVTKVTEQLIAGTTIKYIATATAGTDHIDKEYLSRMNIRFDDAAGCNAYSVAEYIITALSKLFVENNLEFENKKLGVIGCGNVGSKVARFATTLGFNVLRNDPPLARKHDNFQNCSFEEILNCDIITLHVPLNMEGIDKTYHMFSEREFSKLKKDVVFINAARGEVVETESLRNFISVNKNSTVLDVWEFEPDFDSEILRNIEIGTTHIAGYSLEGKLNGTKYVYDKLCKFLGVTIIWEPSYPEIANPIIDSGKASSIEQLLNNVTNQIYPIAEDHKLLFDAVDKAEQERKKHFDLLRKNYRIRREFNNYTIKLNQNNVQFKEQLEKLRFTVI
jgi:erythronate-4-phosphate dehydrogenase